MSELKDGHFHNKLTGMKNRSNLFSSPARNEKSVDVSILTLPDVNNVCAASVPPRQLIIAATIDDPRVVPTKVCLSQVENSNCH